MAAFLHFYTHQQLQHFFGVCVDLDELPIQSRNLEDKNKRKMFCHVLSPQRDRHQSRNVTAGECELTSGTQLSLLSLSSSCSLMEIPLTGPRWIRFIRCVTQLRQTRHKSASIVCSHFAVSVQFYYICSINTRVLFFTHPAILLRRGLLGMMAISSHTLLLVWKSLPRRV